VALKHAVRAFVVACLLAVPHTAATQDLDVATEADVTIGRSSEDIDAAGTQLRIFGSLPGDWRFLAEATWADTWGGTPDDPSDAFGSAYPYNHRVRPMESYVEKTSTSRALWGTRIGRFRTPFGLWA
jgi:hypothetical protein